MPKKPSPGTVTPTQFRLRPETLAEIDAIAAHLAATTGLDASRADAVRYAAKTVAEKIRKKSPARVDSVATRE